MRNHINDVNAHKVYPLSRPTEASPPNELSGIDRKADPEWARVSEIVRRFGIGRTKVFELIRERAFLSKNLKKKGCIKGSRLVNVQSVRDYLNSRDESDADVDLMADESPLVCFSEDFLEVRREDLLTLDKACEMYQLTLEELLQLIGSKAVFGVPVRENGVTVVYVHSLSISYWYSEISDRGEERGAK